MRGIIERRFKTFPALVDLDDTAVDDDYDTGQEDPEIKSWESAPVRRGRRAALIGRHFFGVRGLLIGGASVHDLVVVNGRRLEFTVPTDATSTEVVVLYETFEYTPPEA